MSSKLVDKFLVRPILLTRSQAPFAVISVSKSEGSFAFLMIVAISSNIFHIFIRNIIHGSDSVESANKEIALWFPGSELVEWSSAQESWLYE